MEVYTYARFWKCALQVNPEGYGRAYRGEDHGLTGEEFLAALLQGCQEEGIHVVGIADHGSVQDVDVIRNYLAPHGIVVFPGFEVASSEKVHWVCLFQEDTTTEQLNRYLGALRACQEITFTIMPAVLLCSSTRHGSYAELA